MEYREGVLHIGQVSINDLASRFGTPFYVYDAAVLRRQIERIQRAFDGMPFRPFYAAKANGNLAILRLIRESGFGCDAVSPGEVFLALRAGFVPDRIWFTCSNVSDEDLRAIPDERIVINVNSVSEIDRYLALGMHNPVALRINPATGAGHHADVITAGESVKFGIDLAEVETARMLVEDAGGRVTGLHAHIGSGVHDLDPLLQSAGQLVTLSSQFSNLEWINFGGGLATPYTPGEAEFPIDEYARRLNEIAGATLTERNLTAILEPGRYVVAECGTLVARSTTRRVSAGVEWIGVDSGFNHLTRPSRYDAYHHILNASRGDGTSLRDQWDPARERDAVVIAGNICESGDVFTRIAGAPAPRLIDRIRIGDLLAFCDAGAYGFSMASHYNARLLPPEILVDGADVHVIRQRQELDDLLRGME
jgi:diaminopimelate decarboxylase